MNLTILLKLSVLLSLSTFVTPQRPDNEECAWTAWTARCGIYGKGELVKAILVENFEVEIQRQADQGRHLVEMDTSPNGVIVLGYFEDRPGPPEWIVTTDVEELVSAVSSRNQSHIVNSLAFAGGKYIASYRLSRQSFQNNKFVMETSQARFESALIDAFKSGYTLHTGFGDDSGNWFGYFRHTPVGGGWHYANDIASLNKFLNFTNSRAGVDVTTIVHNTGVGWYTWTTITSLNPEREWKTAENATDLASWFNELPEDQCLRAVVHGCFTPPMETNRPTVGAEGPSGETISKSSIEYKDAVIVGTLVPILLAIVAYL